MKKHTNYLVLLLFIICFGCQEPKNVSNLSDTESTVKHAKGFTIDNFEGYSVLHVTDPWPDANKTYSYVLKKKGANVPDSLQSMPVIQVPIKSLIVTSTTHIPSLQMLGVEQSLTGFPNTNYISSEKVRARIDEGKIRNVGSTLSLNTEMIIDLAPDVIVAHGIDNNNAALDNIQKSGLKLLYNGDWNEKTPLGKAEWIKFFGALFCVEQKADSIFASIEKEYNNTVKLAAAATGKPSVISGALYENKWYLPQGESWGALMIGEAGGNYLWSDTKGSGSLSLPFESVFEKGKDASVWIGPGQFKSLAEMTESNRHYGEFAALKTKNVYSYSTKKGKTGGVIYFELAPNRPDLVIKDLVKILHPELLPDYELYFFEKLK